MDESTSSSEEAYVIATLRSTARSLSGLFRPTTWLILSTEWTTTWAAGRTAI